jgi:peptidoglycan/xylan/chitin deacetylase (PgdA/CDA1 family)
MEPPEWFRWDIRPREIRWPAWFSAWPNGARVVVHLTVLHEWESQPRSWMPAFGRALPPDAAQPTDFLTLGAKEYAFTSGVWRVMEILDRHQVRATVFTNGIAAEVWPESLRELKRRGHEIGSHSWDQGVHPVSHRTREEEREAIRRSIEAIERATGERPQGYMSPGPRPTQHTLELCAEEGFTWCSDLINADLPYVVNVAEKQLILLPYARPGCIDLSIFGGPGLSRGPSEALTSLTDEFDAVYEESARHPMRFNYAFHTYWSGLPGPARTLDAFLRHVRGHPGVWIATGIEQATFWLRQSR